MGKRTSRRQLDFERVGLCAEWIIVGMRPSQVAAQAAKLGWNVDADDLLDIYQAAYEQVITEAVIDVEKESAKAVARLNMLYTRSIAIQDYKTALSVQKEINALVARRSNPMLNGG
jgi:hypothetical protein